MKKTAIIGFIGLCLWSTTLQSCDKDPVGPNGSNNCDSTYVDSTGNDDQNPMDSTDWNGGYPDSTDWNGGGDSDSTDWNGGGNPIDSLPG